MAQFQLLSAYINIGGERGNVVHRGKYSPITYPEALVLQTIHGGSEHVHTLVDVGAVERSPDEEYLRLQQRYGAVVSSLFPGAAGRANLPLKDDTIPTEDDVKAAREAAEATIAARKSGGKKSKSPKTPEPTIAAPAPTPAPEVPDLADLPK